MNNRILSILIVVAIIIIGGVWYVKSQKPMEQQAAAPAASTTTAPATTTTTAPAATTTTTGQTAAPAASTTMQAAAPAASAAAPAGALGAMAGKTVTVATEGAYPPFNFVGSDGSLQGFDVDVANALCEKMQAKCTVVKQDWDGMIPGLLAKKFDAIIASMSITAERKQKIDFSDKYYNTPAVLVAKSDAAIKLGADGNPDPESLKGLKIGVQRATIHENFARAHFPGAEISVYDTADNANLDLTSGRIDVRMDDILVLQDQVVKPNGDKYKIFGKGYVGGELGEGVGVGVRKEDQDLRNAFSAAIKEIRNDGTYKKLNDKYFTFDVYGPESGS